MIQEKIHEAQLILGLELHVKGTKDKRQKVYFSRLKSSFCVSNEIRLTKSNIKTQIGVLKFENPNTKKLLFILEIVNSIPNI